MCYMNFETFLIVHEDINMGYQEKYEVLMASAPPSAPKPFPPTACCEVKSLFFSRFHALGFLQDAALGQSSRASRLPALPAASFPGACCSVTPFSFFHVIFIVLGLTGDSGLYAGYFGCFIRRPWVLFTSFYFSSKKCMGQYCRVVQIDTVVTSSSLLLEVTVDYFTNRLFHAQHQTSSNWELLLKVGLLN